MRKIILSSVVISSTLISPFIQAENTKDRKIESKAEIELGLLHNSHVGMNGIELKGKYKVKTDNMSKTIDSRFTYRPVHINSEYGQDAQYEWDLDILGTKNKRSYFNTKENTLRPYAHSNYSLLTSSGDGFANSRSLTLAEVKRGLGAQVNIGENTHLSAHAGTMIGLEYGKREGLIDVGLYADAELNIADIVNVAGDASMRQSAFGVGYENEYGAGADINLTNSLRIGAEYKHKENKLQSGRRYNTTYGGFKFSGVF